MQPSEIYRAAIRIYTQGTPCTPEIAVDIARRMARSIEADYAARGEFPMAAPKWPKVSQAELDAALAELRAPIPEAKWGVHASHCCFKHGCKYGYELCPVVIKAVAQEHPCEDCRDAIGAAHGVADPEETP